ncbi:DotU/TssL family secretion system protein [Chromobacterium phragmitis]|uniref:DotU/TssL family secretion system protein n=1 Tax=Chromobacterium amazonense TaxID=1382803 RepID=UPI0021B7614F|nr:DotU/TssL family secretion system protein [Chromobacterium amazonense]MBM2886766.1 DotU/TssL family secretion system protein [Chromobacterium amazonense]MDE1715841.1 DotU/TssL family secretion system protein [Chromobacterium amazonense]
MTEESALPVSGAITQAPLTTVFGDAYAEWLQFYDELMSGGLAVDRVVESAAEQASLLTRRLSRNASARVGAAGQSQIDAVQYLFVALVDERLLFQEWPGQTAWQQAPLEQRLFGTRTAGEKVPELIERVLRERDPTTRDLATVCLQCLILGFYGRLRSGGGLGLHEEWRRELFAFVHQREVDARCLDRVLERGSALPPQRIEARRLLPDGFRLGLGIATLAAVVLAASHLFWRDIESRVEPLLFQSNMESGVRK